MQEQVQKMIDQKRAWEYEQYVQYGDYVQSLRVIQLFVQIPMFALIKHHKD